MSSPLLSRALWIAVGLAMISATGCGGAESRRAKHLEKGQAFLAAENFAKARVEFQNALQISPKDPQARFEMGVVDEKLGNPREAAQFYQGTIDLDPGNVPARERLARLYLFSGAPDKALEVIAPVIEKLPDDPQLLTIRAAARIQKKDASGALADAERAVQLAPSNEDAVAVLAGVYSSAGDKAKAQTLLERSIQTIPATVDLRLVLAQIYAQSGRTADTEALLIKLTALKPNEKAHRLRLAQFYAQSNQIDAAENVLRQAIKDLPGERDMKLALVDLIAVRRTPDAAEVELKAMIAADPKDPELQFALARLYEGDHATDKAEAVYREVINKEKLKPPGLTARNRLAALRLQGNDAQGALALAQQVLAQSPRDDEALLLRGNIALAQQDPRAAIADLRAVLRDQPNAVGVLRTLARAHLANGEPAVAEETLRHAVDANPKDPLLRLDFARLLADIGKADQAKPIVQDLVKQKPDFVDALDTEFKISASTKDLTTARSAAEAITSLQPKSYVGYFYQGMVAEAEARTDDALKLYAQAVDLRPDAPEPLQAQIRLLMANKRTADALKRLDELTARFPETSLPLQVKGDLLLSSNQVAEAGDAYKAAIARTPKWWLPYRQLSRVELRTNNPDAALATLRAGLAVTSQPELLGGELAATLEKLGKPDAAISQYEDMLKRYPQSEVIANNLAMLLATYHRDAGSLDRAKQLSVRFANSSNPSFLDTYGWVLYKRGESAASVTVLEKVVAKLPDAPLARYHLGMAESQAGSTDQARDNLVIAVKSGAPFAGLDEAKATLQKLEKSPVASVTTPKT